MGKRGPAPKPTAIRRLQGNPGKRGLNTAEPEFGTGAPACPTWLNAVAKTEWKRIIALLEQAGLITQADMATLAAYCQSYAVWREAELKARKLGRVCESDKGNLYMNPWLGVASSALKDMMRAAAQFGLTPSARSALKVVQPQKAKSLADVLFAKVNDGE